MKTIITFFMMVYILPAVLSAQPAISTNEYYHVGDVIEMVNCNATNLKAGAPGGAQTWDFSKLTPSGGVSTTTVAHDTSSIFTTANLLVTLPDGSTEYMQENNTDSYIIGIYDNATNTLYNYNNYDIAKRPVNYNTTYIDSYRVSVNVPNTYGTGHLTQTGDAYGTLILPTGTYSNVLRIRKQLNETDTTGASGSASAINNVVSYLWFDAIHTAPLFRMDSISGLTGTSNTAMYLIMPSGIRNINSSRSNYYGSIENNTLTIAGTFQNNVIYEVAVYNVIGIQIFKQDFTPDDDSKHFDIGREVRPGVYIVSIAPKNDPGSREVIKLIKQ